MKGTGQVSGTTCKNDKFYLKENSHSMELRQPVLTSPANPVSGLAHLHIVLIQVDQPMERDRTCTLEISQKNNNKKTRTKTTWQQ